MKIKADKINLSGYVTMKDFNSVKGTVGNLTTYVSTSGYIKGSTISSGSYIFGGHVLRRGYVYGNEGVRYNCVMWD